MEFIKREPLYYGGDELHQQKQVRIQQFMEKYGFQGILTFKSELVRYITDFYVKGYRPFMDPEYFAIIPSGKKAVVGYTSGSDDYRLELRSDIDDYRKLGAMDTWHRIILDILSDYGISSGIIATDLLPYHMHDEIKKHLPDLEFVDIENFWVELTETKLPMEIEYLKRAAHIAESGVAAAIDFIKPGCTENEAAAYAEYIMRKNGSEMTPFLTNIVSGENAAIFERVATSKTIGADEMVIIDMGSMYKGYVGDVGRTICTGTPTAEQKKIYRICRQALSEAIQAVKPGVSCESVDETARRVIRESGYGKYEHKFSTGHQLGYGLHDKPLIGKGEKSVLKPNMVISLEPRIIIYDRPGVGGVHLEQNVVVTEDGCQLINELGFSKAFE